jgi:hypothetical protein
VIHTGGNHVIVAGHGGRFVHNGYVRGGRWVGGRWVGGRWVAGFWYGGPGVIINGGGPVYSDGSSDYSDDSDAVIGNDTVAAVQEDLTQAGYCQGPVDGLMGPMTSTALVWFQSAYGLAVTGQIDDSTLQALGND